MVDGALDAQFGVMETPPRLTELRHAIDELDVELLKLLQRRHGLVKQVLAVKRDHNLPALIQSRVDEVINNAVQKAKQMGAEPELARAVWTPMVDWFVRHEERELAKG
jgi:isochorismate pyruvate lyase